MQVTSIIDNPRQKTLFQLMRQALELAKRIKQNNVFLMGQTRSGKSTVFNWIVNNNLLIGKGQKIDPVYEINKLNDNSQIFAQVKQGYKSVTLIPNFVHLSQQLGLIDMPGTRDQRTQVQVMMVSFIYNVFLKASKKAKFVLVITNQGFNAKDSTKMVNLISMFIKLFKCNEMTNQQLQDLFSSVTLLVTSVQVDQELIGQMNQNYRKKLRKLLNFMKQLTKTAQIFPYIQMMINTIIQKQKLEVFPKAKYGKTAQPCYFKQKISEPNSNICQLQRITQFLKFPYAQQYLQLTSEQKNNIEQYLWQKIKNFHDLQKLFSSLIVVFLKSPISNTYQMYQYKEIYQNLIKFYIEKLISDKQSAQNQEMFFKQYTDQQNCNHGPIFILKTIFKLFKALQNFDIIYDKYSKQNLITIYSLTKKVFMQSFDWIVQAFALTRKSKCVMLKIKRQLCQNLDYFKYISQFADEFGSPFLHNLKQYIQFVNQCPYVSFQIYSIFCKNINKQSDISKDGMEIQHINQLISFLNDPQQKIYQKVQSLKDWFQISSKIYVQAAQKCKQEDMHQQSLGHRLQAAAKFAALKVYYSIEIQCNLRETKNIVQDINKIDDKLQDILYDIFVQILEVNNRNYAQFQDILRRCLLFGQISKIYKKYLKDSSKHQFSFLQSYVKICQEQHDYKTSIQIISKHLIKHSQAKTKKAQLLQKKKELQLKLQKETEEEKEKELQNEDLVPKKDSQEITANMYFTIVQTIYTQVLKEVKKITKTEQIYALIKNNLVNKIKEQQQRNQFTVELPLELTNYDILFYSKYLVSKINNRKTIILLGRKAGKSTVSYWLRGKQLVKYGNVIDIKNRQHSSQSKIKHKHSQHTEVPNIYHINEEQLLVDAPHMYQKDPQKMLIFGHILRQIIVNSSQSKFLLVIKQSDILASQCIFLVEMLQFYIQIFDTSFNEKQALVQSLGFLVTFIDNNTILQVRQSLKKLKQQFSKSQNEDIIEEKYHLNKGSRPCSRQQIFILLDYIYRKATYLNFFDIQKDSYKKKKPMIEQVCSQGGWEFHKMKQKIRLNYCSLNPLLEFKQSVHKKLYQEIYTKIQLSREIVQTLNSCFKIVYESHTERKKLDQQLDPICAQLTKLITKQFAQTLQDLRRQGKNIKNFKYSEIALPKTQSLQQKPLVSLFHLFQNHKIMRFGEFQGRSTGNILQAVKNISKCFMKGVRPFFTNINLLQAAWIKIWHILNELQIFQIQTGLKIQELSQSQYSILQLYLEELSSIQFTKFNLNFFNYIHTYDSNKFLLELLEELEKQMKPVWQEQPNFHLVYTILQEIKQSFIYADIIAKGKSYQVNRNVANKLEIIFQCFVQNCPNDQLSAAILYQQCLNYVNPNYYHQFKDSIQQLRLALKSNIQRLCQKLATFDPQSALLICDKYQNSTLKEKVLEIMFNKQKMNRDHFQLFYQMLLQAGNNGKAYTVLQSWKSKSKISQQQYQSMLERIKSNEKNKNMGRNSSKDITLQELRQIITEMHPIFDSIKVLID